MTPSQFNNVLVAIDGSEGAERALDCAISLVERLGGKLTALVVEGKLPAYAATAGEVDEVKKEKDAFFQRVLEGARELAKDHGVELETDLVPGHAAEVITHYAKAHGHDLIVIGHRGHFLGDYLLGSTADRVSHHAHCPVIVVR
jgi:nucleotide-binding universal stress UspA family protein